MNTKLSNQDFVTRADKSIVEKEKKKKIDFEDRLQKLKKNLKQLN